MAIAFAALNATYLTTNVAAYDTGATYTPTANALVLAAVTHGDVAPEGACTSFAGNGGTWVRIGETVYDTIASNRLRCCLYRTMIASPTTTIGTLTLPDAGEGANIRVCEFTGVDTSGTDGSGAVVQVVTNNADATANPNATLAALDASGNNAVFALVGSDVNSAGQHAAETNWTLDTDSGQGNPASRLTTFYRLATTDNTFVDTATARDWGVIAVEIKVASAATKSPPVTRVPRRRQLQRM